MPDPAAPRSKPGESKDPNFFAVVVMSAIVLLLVFAGAWLFIMHSSKHVLPNPRPNPQPTSYLSFPGPRTDAA